MEDMYRIYHYPLESRRFLEVMYKYMKVPKEKFVSKLLGFLAPRLDFDTVVVNMRLNVGGEIPQVEDFVNMEFDMFNEIRASVLRMILDMRCDVNVIKEYLDSEYDEKFPRFIFRKRLEWMDKENGNLENPDVLVVSKILN